MFRRARARELQRRAVACAVTLAVAFVATSLSSAAARPGVSGTASTPQGLTVNFLSSPVDLDLDGDLELGWQTQSGQQEAYQVWVDEVAPDPGESRVVWRSPRIESAESTAVSYAGPALEPGRRYTWKVRVWSDRGRPSAWSEPASFGTALGDDWGDAQPIWAGTGQPEKWADYSVTARVKITETALGVRFRSPRDDLGYMWQFRADNDQLVPHVTDGGYRTLGEPVSLQADVAPDSWHEIRIDSVGNTFTTWFDGTRIDQRTHALSPQGVIGFRTGRTESGLVDEVTVTSLAPGSEGEVLYRNDFAGSQPSSTCGQTRDGALVVGRSVDCLSVRLTDWTDYSMTARVNITRTALGVRFRSPRRDLGYMWQLRADDRLVPHTVDGSYKTLGEAAPLQTDVRENTWHEVRIDSVGDTITTWFDGVRVDQRENTLSSAGVIGFRTGRSETGLVDEVTVTSLAPGSEGQVLYENDFESGTSVPCGPTRDGALVVGTSVDCLSVNLSRDWALMRDEVQLPEDKEVAWASVYATGSDFDSAKQFVYKLYLDGEFVGLGPTDQWGGETRYDGFDVTDMVRSGGRHALSAVAYTQDDQRFLATMVVRFTDGTTRRYATGPGWRTMLGNEVWTSTDSIGTGYYHAPVEDLQMSEYPEGFMEVGFDDSAWEPPALKQPFVDLAPTPFAKVEQQTHSPVRIVDKGDGDYFVDFGRTWIGGVRLTVHGSGGEQVALRFGEELSSADTVDHTMRTGNTYEDVITLRPGEQTVDTWGMRVFRYLDIVDSPEPITEENLQALAQVYPFDDDAAQVTSSEENLVAVWQLSKNTIESLNHNFFTDSWTRERTNYEADAYLQQLANAHLSDDPTLGTYSLDYFQTNGTWPTEWPMYVISAAYDNWQHTGSTDQLERTYDSLVPKLLDERYDPDRGTIVENDAIVDWPSSQRDGFVFREQNTVLNALAYRNYADMARIAEVLGRDSDASTFRHKAATLRSSLNEKFFDEQKGAYDDGLDLEDRPSGHFSVHASVFSAAFGAPESEQRYDRVADYLAERGMRCSVYCSGFFLKALYDAGRGQQGLDLLTSTGEWSWMNMIEDGAGATGEAWDPSMKGNMTYSHPWAAAPAYVVPRDMYGIRPTTPGYATFDVRPQMGDQSHGSVTMPSVKGNIGVAFRVVDGRTDLRVDVPGNTEADVHLPSPAGFEGDTVYVDGQARRGTATADWISVPVGPGCHVVSTSASASSELEDVCR